MKLFNLNRKMTIWQHFCGVLAMLNILTALGGGGAFGLFIGLFLLATI